MSGFTSVGFENVQIKHHSTSSQVEIVVEINDEYEQGKFRRATRNIWLDYSDFDNLIKAIDQIKTLTP